MPKPRPAARWLGTVSAYVRRPDQRRVEECRVRILNGLRDPRPNLIEVVGALDELVAIAKREARDG